MICPDCNGTGRRGATLWPCEACTGGIASCCDTAGSSGSVEDFTAHPAHIHAQGHRPDHLPYAYCWCDPEEISDGVWLHRDEGRFHEA